MSHDSLRGLIIKNVNSTVLDRLEVGRLFPMLAMEIRCWIHRICPLPKVLIRTKSDVYPLLERARHVNNTCQRGP